jgi:hypothetical protein
VREPVFLQQFCWPSKEGEELPLGSWSLGDSGLDYSGDGERIPSISVACGENPPIEVDYLVNTTV